MAVTLMAIAWPSALSKTRRLKGLTLAAQATILFGSIFISPLVLVALVALPILLIGHRSITQ